MDAREPVVAPVAVSFSPTWFHRHYGVDYSEPTWQDPVVRVERSRELARLTFERFGDVGLGSEDPPPQPVMSDAYGNYFMPAERIAYLWCAEVSERTADETVRALRTANERIAV